ncbi:transglycosylase SLT domain-containing protein [Shewanella sp.]|uniref:transglycosylase SLT domain-containing protein n=1 Tax=Shewanella sp. TaxID=50422 RepID=UPI00356A161C
MLKQFYGICLTSLALFSGTVEADIQEQRRQFILAEKALLSGDKAGYRQSRAKLNDYPLSIYLDFNERMDTLIHVSGKEALAAFADFENTPLIGSVRYRYLKMSGIKGRWDDFLTVSPEAPRDTVLQCYYYQAKIATGAKTEGYDGARRLWLDGHSRPKECDPLFNLWIKAGQRTQELIWSRMFLAYEAREGKLLSYLAQKVTNHPKEAQKLLALYKDPRNLRHTERYRAKAAVMAEMVELALKALSRKDLEEAVALMAKYEKAGRFSKIQAKELHAYLVRRVLVRQESSLQQYCDKHLSALASDDLTELRLRWALRDKDDEAFHRFMPLLSSDTANKDRWLYWQTRFGKDIDKDTVSNAKASLLADRSFYGFALANHQNSAPSLNERQLATDFDLAILARDPGFARMNELLTLERPRQARSEWLQLLGRSNDVRKTEYGRWAEAQGMYALAVDASIQGKFWDDLAMRFPNAEEQGFSKAAKAHKLNKEELRAIARRESAFNPTAMSGVGARGLMQLMPATAKQTAKKQGLKYKGEAELFEPAFNIRLGSAYYAQLLERYNDNRVLATAAYNAGPSRVDAWLARTQGKLDVMAFIEAIPFRETREYVQAVLSYRLIYEHRKGESTPLFSEKELNFSY